MRRLRYGFVFSLLAATCGYWAFRLGFPFCVVLGNIAVCWACVAAAFLAAIPGLLGKQSNGRLHPIAWLVYWPYVLLSLAILKLTARLSSEPAVSEITPHLLLGRRLSPGECVRHLPEKLAGTIDLTAEFAEPGVIRDQHYLCIPTLDTLDPSIVQLKEAILFIDTHQGNGPVFVHCAMGHGRSATIAAAHLMQSKGLSPDEAVRVLKSVRPGVGLHSEQFDLLVQLEREYNQPGSETGSKL